MSTIEVKVPDIGDFKDVPVIEVFVKPGDAVKAEDPLVTLESDKATMDVPAPTAGTVKELKVKVGDKVSEGSVILILETTGAAAPGGAAGAKAEAPVPAPSAAPSPKAAAAAEPAPSAKPAAAPVDAEAFRGAHASPSVRAFARTLGVDLSKVKAAGPRRASCRRTCRTTSNRRSAAPPQVLQQWRQAGPRSGCCRGRRAISPS